MYKIEDDFLNKMKYVYLINPTFWLASGKLK